MKLFANFFFLALKKFLLYANLFCHVFVQALPKHTNRENITKMPLILRKLFAFRHMPFRIFLISINFFLNSFHFNFMECTFCWFCKSKVKKKKKMNMTSPFRNAFYCWQHIFVCFFGFYYSQNKTFNSVKLFELIFCLHLKNETQNNFCCSC